MTYNFQSVLQIRNNTVPKPRRQSLDLHDLFLTSPPWPPSVRSPGPKDCEKEAVSGDWVDKIVVNKQDHERSDNIMGWEEDDRQSPDMFYPKQNSQSQTVTPYDSDDPDATTSDSSEIDFHWQPNVVHKANNIPSMGSKLRKPSPKQIKNPELRYIINHFFSISSPIIP